MRKSFGSLQCPSDSPKCPSAAPKCLSASQKCPSASHQCRAGPRIVPGPRISAALGLVSVPQCLAWDALGTLLDALGRNLALPTGLQAPLARHLALQTGLQVQFGLDFELFWVPPRVVFHDVVTLLPLPALTFSKKTRPTKNRRKP